MKRFTALEIDLFRASPSLRVNLSIASDLSGIDLLAAVPVNTPAFGSRSSLGLESPSGVLLERWARVGEWKLVDVENRDDRLHNLASDPKENVNLVDNAEYSSMQENLKDVLETLWLEY